MQGPLQSVLRWFTHVTRPIALHSAGKAGSPTAVICHTGRQTGRPYRTPVIAAHHDDTCWIALPYGPGTDWLRNVLASGRATLLFDGQTLALEAPTVVPIAEATPYFRPKEQRLQHRFRVESAVRLRQVEAGAEDGEALPAQFS